MQPIQIDETYYTNYDDCYKPLADAFQQVGPAPCTVFDCPRYNACKEEEVDCKAFRFWVNNGKMETKERGVTVSIEKDMQKILKKC